jgi:hypothetical protein
MNISRKDARRRIGLTSCVFVGVACMFVEAMLKITKFLLEP